ncbi:MAG: hypothetical protein DRR06_10405 [Gammaproteobacteria bacterium]|nr:MAG: hypothetical protein DRR06_10405 [Gammaproteobacteria bacterium]
MRSANLTAFASAFVLFLLALPQYAETKDLSKTRVVPEYINLEFDDLNELCSITEELLSIEPKKEFMKKGRIIHLTLEEHSRRTGLKFMLGEQTIVPSEQTVFAEEGKVALIVVDWRGIAESTSAHDFFVRGVDIEVCAEAFAPRADSSSGDTSLQNAVVKNLDDVEALVSTGDKTAAIGELHILRERLDGCGEAPDKNDWIAYCDEQALIREYIDLLIANLTD